MQMLPVHPAREEASDIFTAALNALFDVRFTFLFQALLFTELLLLPGRTTCKQ